MEEKKSDSITINKNDLWKYATFVLLAVLVIGAIVVFTGDKNNGNDNGNSNPDPVVVDMEELLDDDAVLGDKNAPVTIVEFSDYQCPFCRKFWTDTFPSLKKDYIDTGKVKFIFRDFPLASLHPMAQKSAEAAECVKEKGGDAAYYKFHDKVFEEGNIIDSGNAKGPVTKTAVYTNEDLKQWASEIGYDISTCLDSGKYASEVQNDLRDGSSVGVQGTPAFFINGKLLEGAQPYSVIKQVIDAELAK